MNARFAIVFAAALLASCAPSASRRVADTIAMQDPPAGAFVMGADAAEGLPQGFPRHRVDLKPFRIGRHEITFDQYDAFAEDTGRSLPDDAGWGRGSRPVINVDLEDVQAFIAWLNQSGRRFRLPSEAEWEYAARAGSTGRYWWGNAFDPSRANTSVNQGRDVWPFTAPVGSLPPNPFGLYDTSGNVWEWTADCTHGDFVGAPVDGSARTDPPCDSRVVRGGSWYNVTRASQSTGRAAAPPGFRSKALGFRLAETVGRNAH